MEVSTRLWMVAVLCEIKCGREKLTEKVTAGFDERQVVEQHLAVGRSRCVLKTEKCALLGMTY